MCQLCLNKAGGGEKLKQTNVEIFTNSSITNHVIYCCFTNNPNILWLITTTNISYVTVSLGQGFRSNLVAQDLSSGYSQAVSQGCSHLKA